MTTWIGFFLMLSAVLGTLLSMALGVWVYVTQRPRSLPESPPWLNEPAPLPAPSPIVDEVAYARLDRVALAPLTVDEEAYLAFRTAEYRQELEDRIQRHLTAKAEIAAQFDDWLVTLSKQYKLWQYDELKGFERWVALILRHSQLYHGGKFPVKEIWREVKGIYGTDAPRKRYTSYTFFRQLNEALIEAGIVSRGRPGVAARLIPDKLPDWVNYPSPPNTAPGLSNS